MHITEARPDSSDHRVSHDHLTPRDHFTPREHFGPREDITSNDHFTRMGEARNAATRVIGSWVTEHCPEATDEEVERLAREVVRAVRRAVTPRVLPPGHTGLTSKPCADADAARRIAARLEAELQSEAPRRPVPRVVVPALIRRPPYPPRQYR